MPTRFQEKVYAKLRKVPKGNVTTYADLAKAVGSKAFQAVGTAMRLNPYAPEVPCHRVVRSDGSVGRFSGRGGVEGKIWLLENEGISIKKGKIADFERKLHRF